MVIARVLGRPGILSLQVTRLALPLPAASPVSEVRICPRRLLLSAISSRSVHEWGESLCRTDPGQRRQFLWNDRERWRIFIPERLRSVGEWLWHGVYGDDQWGVDLALLVHRWERRGQSSSRLDSGQRWQFLWNDREWRHRR